MPATYGAVRTAAHTYVEYDNGEHEYYDAAADPYQLTNTYAGLSSSRQATLRAELDGLTSCHTGASCWTAGHAS